MNLTVNETAVLRRVMWSEYEEGAIWSSELFDKSFPFPPASLPGVVSSLVKKGMVLVLNYEGTNNPKDNIVEVTDAGQIWLADNGFTNQEESE